MADRIAILDHGRLVQVGPPREVYERPATRFAADFIGVTNFLPVEAREDRWILATGAPLAATAPARGRRAHAAIRPERLHLHDPAHDNRLDGRVVATAYHGLDLQLHVATDAAPATVPQVTDRVASAAICGANSRASHIIPGKRTRGVCLLIDAFLRIPMNTVSDPRPPPAPASISDLSSSGGTKGRFSDPRCRGSGRRRLRQVARCRLGRASRRG